MDVEFHGFVVRDVIACGVSVEGDGLDQMGAVSEGIVPVAEKVEKRKRNSSDQGIAEKMRFRNPFDQKAYPSPELPVEARNADEAYHQGERHANGEREICNMPNAPENLPHEVWGQIRDDQEGSDHARRPE